MVTPKTGCRFVNELADRKIRADAILNIDQPRIGIADQGGIKVSGYTRKMFGMKRSAVQTSS